MESLIMNIKKSNVKIYYIIITVVLAAVLITTLGGFFMQQQNTPVRANGMGMGSSNPMQPESAQTGPTGRLVTSTGVILLLIGSGVLIGLLWAGRSIFRGTSP